MVDKGVMYGVPGIRYVAILALGWWEIRRLSA
jgi:hypothetical protein